PDVANHDFRMPRALDEVATSEWARQHSAAFRARVTSVLSARAVNAALVRRARALSEALFRSHEQVLLWCSGKDLMAAMEPWLRRQTWRNGRAVQNAGDLRAGIRDWIRSHPEEALSYHPAWRALVLALRA